MRLWTLHPRHLDAAGLVAIWREGLLARAVLSGLARGYRSHPQLARFRDTRRPIASLDTYLAVVCDEADRRGNRFDRAKLGRGRVRVKVAASRGQLDFEWAHLRRKLRARARPAVLGDRSLSPSPHPLFRVVRGPVAPWERGH
jgi:Pyrimidine dimer DNA glycosylase